MARVRMYKKENVWCYCLSPVGCCRSKDRSVKPQNYHWSFDPGSSRERSPPYLSQTGRSIHLSQRDRRL